MPPGVPQQDQHEALLAERLKWAWHFLRKNLWLLALLGTLGIAGAHWWTQRQPRRYRAEASLVINTVRPQILAGFKQINDLGTSRYWLNTDFFNTQFDILKSRNVARRVVEALSLHENSSFVGVKSPSHDRQFLIELAVDVLIKRARVITIKQNRVVRIQVTDGDPSLARKLANAYVVAYKEYVEQQRKEVTAYASRWLRNKVKSLAAEMALHEKALAELREKHQFNFEIRRASIAVRIKTLVEQLTLARRNRFELASRHRDMGRYRSADDVFLVGHSAVVSSRLIQRLKLRYILLSGELATLKSKYLEKHPAVITMRTQLGQLRRRVRQEIDNIRHTVKMSLKETQLVESGLVREIRDAQREDMALELASNQLYKLLENLKRARTVYERVKKQLEETELTSDQKITNIRIVDWARQPNRAIYPKVPLNLALGLCFGLLLGLVGAALRESLNTRVQRITQVEDQLALPFLGLMPYQRHLKSRHDISSIIALSRSEFSNFCRLIRTNLERKSPANARAFVVTSPNPREGKTVMTVTMGVTMASGGRRTIIVDADMFKPRIHRIFSLDNARGFANYLRNPQHVDWRSLVHPTPVSGLDVITAGTTGSIPTDLLDGAVLRAFVDELRREYDCVLFDTPPVLSTSDAMVLSSYVDGVIFVLNSLRTSFQTAETAKRHLARSNVEVTGVVLNKINRGSVDYKYYYKSYEQQAYLPDAVLSSSELLPIRSRAATAHKKLLVEATPNLSIADDLKRAVGNFEWELRYQPIVDLKDQRILGYEALIRWCHPDRGLLLPAEFIAEAERCGVIHLLSKWVLCEACRFIKDLPARAESAPFISVNLSERQFAEQTVIAHVALALKSSGLDPRLLHLEVPEHVAGRSDYQRLLRDLNALGVQLVVGDLGAGTSSLPQLADAPVKIAKIDRNLVKNLGTKPETELMIRNLLRLCAELGIQVIALGVETKLQVEILSQLGCQSAQGYYFAEPLTSAEVRDDSPPPSGA